MQQRFLGGHEQHKIRLLQQIDQQMLNQIIDDFSASVEIEHDTNNKLQDRTDFLAKRKKSVVI